jgi:nicotinate-nucleotide adenylyltransferase
MRLGLFGGTFDPIHEAHLEVAEAARDRFGLDEVLVIPNRQPPHKEAATGASYEDRLRMVELACAGRRGLRASDLENQAGKSYTIQTLRRLRTEKGKDCEFFFIIGADAFAEVGLWYEVQEVFRMTEFIVVSRPGFDYPVPEGARVRRLEGLELKVSSTEVRAKLRRGETVAELPEAVRRYIGANGLYRQARTAQ